MIKPLLKKIRSKPKTTRNSIALSIAGSFTAMIFMVWLYQLPARYTDIQDNSAEKESSFAQLFSSIKDQVKKEEENVDTADFNNNVVVSEDFEIVMPGDDQSAGVLNAAELATSTADSEVLNFATEATSSASVIEPTGSESDVVERPIRIITVNKSSTTAATATSP